MTSVPSPRSWLPAHRTTPFRQGGAKFLQHRTQGVERHGAVDEIPENGNGARLIVRAEFRESGCGGVGSFDGEEESPRALGPGVSEMQVRDREHGGGFEKRGSSCVEGPSAFQPDPLGLGRPWCGLILQVR